METMGAQGEMGILKVVKMRRAMGRPRPRRVPMRPPEREMKTDSVRNWRRISRLVAPRALRMPISLIRDCTLASMEFMMPTPETMRVMKEARVRTMVSMSAIWRMVERMSVSVWAL
jgi:hypothetical protein